MDETTTNIYGIYFICCINNYLEVVKEQMEVLKKGLLNITKKLIIFITNYRADDKLLDDILMGYNENNKLIIVTSPENLYEKFAINNYKKYITDANYYMYYFHTKGVKDKNNPFLHIFTSRRKLLNFYTLEKYKVNIELLQSYDAVGCCLNLHPKKHFSGNFWWSKSDYLNNLSYINDNYLSPEMYILSNDECEFISLANDTNDTPIENYEFRDDENILQNVTKDMIIINEHIDLLHFC